MKKIINRDTKKYLDSLEFPNFIKLIVTDLDTSVYYSNNGIKKTINKDLLKYICSSKSGILTNPIKIFENKDDDMSNNSQIIYPLHYNNTIVGSLILINTKYIFDKSNIDIAKVIKTNIETNLKNLNTEKIENLKNNPIYNTKYTNSIKKILDNSIKEIYVDNNYKNIEELLFYKIESLKSSLKFNELEILRDIIELFKEKSDYLGIYGFAMGTHATIENYKTKKKEE